MTNLIRNSIEIYTEEKWSEFLGKLGPYPPSSSIFWQIINQARSQKKASSIPTLVVGDLVYESDEDKANLFASILGKTFTETGDDPTQNFDPKVYRYVEEFVSKSDYTDDEGF